ncbi:MAG: hypothetical protein LBD01_05625 [Puniceicoccales bacterium]|jgi:hypothetical protein|nr:hypothetical protein [Puniceicoccales bacterium]
MAKISSQTRIYSDATAEAGDHASRQKSCFVGEAFDNRDSSFLKITVEHPLRLTFAISRKRKNKNASQSKNVSS